jgi:putative membrane protein
MMYGWGYNNGYGYDIWSFVFMLLMMALVVVGIIAVVRHLSRNSGTGQSGDAALDVLRKRYASGEIDKKEFEEKQKDLSK